MLKKLRQCVFCYICAGYFPTQNRFSMSSTIFTRFLTQLGVPHTAVYSDSRFKNMTFKSLFGLSHLLKEYGIDNTAWKVEDKSELTSLTPPFLAQTRGGVFVIVTGINSAQGSITYDSLGQLETASVIDFSSAWNGIVLTAYPTTESCEPDYRSHHLTEIISKLSGYALCAAALAVFLYFFVTRHIYARFSTVLLTVFDLIGLYFSYMLLQKTLNIHTKTSERVCGVLEHGGCDSIISLKVSKLFGVFSWSEVGFGYFGISLCTLLLFPHMLSSLALCNLCCLPYTFWSIWYQRFKAHHWCTLCVGVQSILWLLFFCYLGSGAFSRIVPLHFDFVILLAVYIFTVLFINLILRTFKNLPCHENNISSQS